MRSHDEVDQHSVVCYCVSLSGNATSYISHNRIRRQFRATRPTKPTIWQASSRPCVVAQGLSGLASHIGRHVRKCKPRTRYLVRLQQCQVVTLAEAHRLPHLVCFFALVKRRRLCAQQAQSQKDKSQTSTSQTRKRVQLPLNSRTTVGIECVGVCGETLGLSTKSWRV